MGIVKGTAEKIHSIAVAAAEQSSACEEIARTTKIIHQTAGDTLESMNEAGGAVSEINAWLKRCLF